MAFFARLLKVDLQVLLGPMWHAKELINVKLKLGAFFPGTSVLWPCGTTLRSLHGSF